METEHFQQRKHADYVPEDNLEVFAITQLSAHWRNYYATAPEERLGDEDFWDRQIPISVAELGIDPRKAEQLCVIAKLEAQLDIH